MGPECGLDGTACEHRPVFGMMGKNDAFTGTSQNHRMIADNRTAAQCCKADGAGFARAGITVTHAHAVFRQCNVAPLRCRFAEKQRGAGRCIDLVLVVHLENFDVEIRRIERLRCFLHQNGQKIDAEAHIAGFDDGCMAGGGADFLVVFSRAARRADDVHDARLRSKPCKFHACRRACEVEDAVRLGKDR